MKRREMVSVNLKSVIIAAVLAIGILLLVLFDYNEQISRGGRAPRFVLDSRDSVNFSHVWSEWQESTCTFTATRGCKAFKNRVCDKVGACEGSTFEWIQCTSSNCPAFWTEWTLTKNTEGRCTQMRQRNCTGFQNSGCSGYSTQSNFCNVSGWTSWSQWTCHHAKDEYCHNQRDRECLIGLDQSTCVGNSSESVPCSPTVCKDYFFPQWSKWSAWSCDDAFVCFNTRTRTCSTGKDQDCASVPKEVVTCDSCEGSVRWLQWSPWSCVQTHGINSLYRARNCSTGNADDCHGNPYGIVQNCNQSSCPECFPSTALPTSVYWHEWESWSCELRSGVTFRVRLRTCSTGNDGDCLIYGENNQLEQCTSVTCPGCFGPTTSTASTQSIVSTIAPAIDTCNDAEHDKCSTSEWLGVVCADSDLAALYCQKSCNLCYPTVWSHWTQWECSRAHGLTFRIRYRDCISGACQVDDNHSITYCDEKSCPECFSPTGGALEYCRDVEDQCNNKDFRDIVCKEPALATRYCSKSCNLCVPADNCKEGPGCEAELKDVVCDGSNLISACPILCGLCVLPDNCFEGHECRPELKAEICFNYVTRLRCPILCSLCDPTSPAKLTTYPLTSLATIISSGSSTYGSTSGSVSSSTDNSGVSNGPTIVSGSVSSTTDSSGVSNGPTIVSGSVSSSTDNSGVSNGPTTASGSFSNSTDNSGWSIVQTTIHSVSSTSRPIDSSTGNAGVSNGATSTRHSSSDNPTSVTFITNPAAFTSKPTTDYAGNTNSAAGSTRWSVPVSMAASSVSSEPTTSSGVIAVTTDNTGVSSGPTQTSGLVTGSTGSSGSSGVTTLNVGSWSPWIVGQCPVTCGQGTTMRFRQCSTGNPQDCAGNAFESVNCHTGACSAGTWSPWIVGQCPVTCGQGTTTRFRQCSTGNHQDCAGNAFESVTCNAGPCPGSWSAWIVGQCPVTCGQGTTMRFRQCNTGNQQDCAGNAFESVDCSASSLCQGTWSPWIVGQCPVTCGQGTTTRFRQCSTGNNQDCAGNTFESVTCNASPCPGTTSSATLAPTPAPQCLSGPCHHGGSCEDLPGTFSCHCTGGYYGKTCDDDYDECEYRRHCLNGAICLNTVGSYKCVCAVGFTGQDCDQPTRDCVDVPTAACEQQQPSRCNEPVFARLCPRYCKQCDNIGAPFIG